MKDKEIEEKSEELRKTGIDIIGDVPWGMHICYFYQTKEDLIDILVPYFKIGLENNEFCVWITSEPLKTEGARAALNKEIKDLDEYIRKGQIEILDYSQWYTKSGKFEADNILSSWVEKEKQALKKGFNGLRLTGNTFWLEKKDWKDFVNYEKTVNNVISKHKMLAICSYPLDKCGASEIVDVTSNHQFALIGREGKLEIIENTECKKAEGKIKFEGEKMKDYEKEFRKNFIKKSLNVIILMLLNRRSMSGFELIKQINKEFGFLFGSSTIYPILYSLEDYGLLSSIKNGKSIEYRIRDRQKVHKILYHYFELRKTLKKMMGKK